MCLTRNTFANIALILVAVSLAPVHADEPNSNEPPATSNDVSSTPAVPPFLKRPIPIEGDFIDGWIQTVPIETQHSKGESITLWIEDGWLAARRNSATGTVEWQVYLCPVDDIEEPMISVRDGLRFVEVSYSDGRYFIRDSDHVFRCRRLPKPGGKLMKKSDMVSDDALGRGSANSGATGLNFLAVMDGDWFCIGAGPTNNQWNAFVRLDPDPEKKGHGVTVFATGLTYWQRGDKWLMDDGELIVANRTLEASYLAKKKEAERQGNAASN